MSERTTISSNHLYRLLSVYTGLAFVGVLVTLLYGLLARYPQIAIWGFIATTVLILLRRVIPRRFVQFSRLRQIQKMRGVRSATVEDALTVPPALGEFIFYILLPNNQYEILGDLLEDYLKLQTRFSKRHANIWFWKQVFVSVLPLLRWRWKSILSDSSLPAHRKEQHVKTILPFYQR